MSAHQPPVRSTAVKPKDQPIVRHATGSGGLALDPQIQSQMGARFGHDFSQVRVHTDSQAADGAQSLNANAFAYGSDIVFDEGRYQPDTQDGQRLIAHELTHVVQQSLAPVSTDSQLSRESDSSEREADSIADGALDGGAVQVQESPDSLWARDENDKPFWDSPIFKGLVTGAGLIPGPAGGVAKMLGHPFGVARGMEDATSGSPVQAGLDFAGAAAGLAGGMAQIGGFSMLGTGGLGGAAAAIGEGGIGTLGTVGGLGAGAGATLPASAVLGGAGLEGVAALGPAAAVVGAGLGGVAAGTLLANHTEVGQDSADVVGGIDSLLTGDGERSAMLRLDEYRQDQWDAGGLGYAKSIGAGVAEGAVGLGGAVGGLLEGAYHGVGAIGSGIAGLFGSSPSPNDAPAPNPDEAVA